MMWGHGDGAMTWMGATMLVLLMVLTLSVALIVVLLARSSSRSVNRDPIAAGGLPADATLARRLAAGEITVDQYETIRDALHRGAAS